MSLSHKKFLEATVTSKGQVTIPAEIRRRSGIKKNTKVRFNMMEDGTVQMSVIKGREMEDREELIATIEDLMEKYKTGIDYLKNKYRGMFKRGTIDDRQCRDSKKKWPKLSVNKRTAYIVQI